MMGTVFEDLSSAFMDKLVPWAAGQSPIVPINDENSDFVPTQGVLYVEARHLPARTYQSELGDYGRNLTRGIFQISVMAPTNQGRGKALAVADSLQQLFHRGTALAFGNLNDIKLMAVSIAPALMEPDWYRVPVSIEYYMLTVN